MAQGGSGSIVLEMEKKLNYERYRMRGKRDKYCKLSLNYYWDLLKYVDDDYLTEWEILKFKDLYGYMLSSQVLIHASAFGLGVLLSYPIMHPIISTSTHGFINRLPVAAMLGFFLSIQAGNWIRPNQYFHEIMAQPNPHGSYIRKVIRYHFPRLWNQTSHTLYENGYNLIEMNEYDSQTRMPELDDEFDTSLY